MIFATGIISEGELLFYTANLIAIAMLQDGFDISPAGNNIRFRDCLMIHKGRAFIMYNNSDNSTKIASMPIKCGG